MMSSLPTNTATAMPTLNAATEKPIHYTYLKEFRVTACPLFKQHQCQMHRPYTCFHWHFANQRRRRPMRKRDGTFNYSPDIYCSKYDENTGMCPDGDECPFLHRVAGDVERKYHLRYYKTANCVHQTDTKGHCTKNGVHCAFAHSPDDLRQPVYDIRELQSATENGCGAALQAAQALYSNESKERTSFVVEDTIWQNQEHVLSCYKTARCLKPPRLCRQGYACPYYHNAKDRRRPPAVHKYRSTPCPSAKLNDEWSDPDACENGDQCQYCHSRTEQQFHPEIYKSTKCNDMLQHGYCPRGPFCAFAHNDGELHAERHLHAPANNINHETTLEPKKNEPTTLPMSQPYPDVDIPEAPRAPGDGATSDVLGAVGVRRSISGDNVIGPSHGTAPSYSAVLKQRSTSQSSASSVSTQQQTRSGVSAMQQHLQQQQQSSILSSSYPRAPGFEREHHSPPRTWTPDFGDRTNSMASTVGGGRARTTSLSTAFDRGLDLGYNFTSSTEALGTSPLSASTGGLHGRTNSLSGGTTARRDTLESLGNLLEDTISSGDEMPLPPINERDEFANHNARSDAQPISIPSSMPGVTMPAGAMLSGGSLPTGGGMFGDGQFAMSGSFGSAGSPFSNAQQQLVAAMINISHTANVPTSDANELVSELLRTREELASHRAKVRAWEDGLKQARQACEAWKREAELHKARAQQSDIEKTKIKEERDAAMSQLAALHAEFVRLQQQQQRQSGFGNISNGVAGGALFGPGFEQLVTQLHQQQQQQFGGTTGGATNSTTAGGATSATGGAATTGGPMCPRCGRIGGAATSSGCSRCSTNTTNSLKSIASST